jgi:small-conductance mechanosensitive channel
MGFLILVEGQYYVGDVVNVGGVEGTVEEVGLRRTILRDPSGTVHSVSNGQIRVSANFTRIYASAVVDIQGIRDEDLERAIEVMHQVGLDLAADPTWTDRLLKPPTQPIAFAFTDLGATVRMTCRCVPEDRWRVAAELRKRIAMAFAAAGLQPNRRTGGGPV